MADFYSISDKQAKSLYAKPLGLDALNACSCFMAASVPVAAVSAMACGSVWPAAWAYFLPLVLLWVLFIDYKINNFALFVLAILPIAALALIPKEFPAKIAYGVYALVVIVFCIVRRGRHENKNIGGTATMLIVGMFSYIFFYLMADTLHIPFMRPSFLWTGMLFCVLYVCYMHAGKLDYSLFVQNQAAMDQPVKTVKKANRKHFRVFLGVLIAVIVIVMLIPWDENTGLNALLDRLGKALLALWYWIMSLIPNNYGEMHGFDESYMQEISQAAQESQDLEESGGYSKFMDYSGQIFAAIAVVAILALVVFLLIKIVKAFYKRGSKLSRWGGEEADAELDEVHETIVHTEKEKKTRRAKAETGNEKVRELFYNRVDAHIDREVKRSDTAEQIGTKLENPTVTALVDYYDKARYSENGVTPEDVSAAEKTAANDKKRR